MAPSLDGGPITMFLLLLTSTTASLPSYSRTSNGRVTSSTKRSPTRLVTTRSIPNLVWASQWNWVMISSSLSIRDVSLTKEKRKLWLVGSRLTMRVALLQCFNQRLVGQHPYQEGIRRRAWRPAYPSCAVAWGEEDLGRFGRMKDGVSSDLHF